MADVRPESMIRITTEELAQQFIDEQVKALREQIGSKKVRCYYSGIRYAGADRKIPRASIVRAVVPEREDASNEILSLLDVNFIHSDNKLPVLPFPFKFLREYQQQFHIQHLDENEK